MKPALEPYLRVRTVIATAWLFFKTPPSFSDNCCYPKQTVMTTDKFIIYVEDDPDDILLMQEAFSEIEGYGLLTLNNGAELLKYLERALCFPNLIILDINMPVLNGRETLRLLKQHPIFSSIPVVMFSTGSMAHELLFASAYKTDLVVKPFDYATLRKTVRRLVSYAQVPGLKPPVARPRP
jgi:CheY-like chemotaxis protein